MIANKLIKKGGEKMKLIRWNPFNLSSAFDDDFELPTMPLLNKLGQGLNLYETESTLVAEAALPGISENEVDVTIDDGIVHITASSSEKKEEKDKRRYFMSSRSTSFNYTFRLPEGLVKDGEPKAELEKGVLTLVFKKIEKKPPKVVKVTAIGK